MSTSTPKSMKAVVIEKFGGPEVFHTATVPVPEIGDKDILIQVDMAGIGEWDPWLAEGGMGSLNGFPMVIGSDGSGTVVGVGRQVKRFRVGDQVYGYSYDNPKGGFYAEYASIPEDYVAKIPVNVGMNAAGALPASGITALLGLEERGLKKGQNVAILGASGGVGHVAVQLAKLMGARVLAVASGDDGVSLVRRLGADFAIDGHKDDVASVAKSFDPNGLDAVLAFAYSPDMKDVLGLVKNGGHVVFPNGVEPEPKGGRGVKTSSYDGLPGREVFDRLNRLVESGPFQVEIGRTYSMDEMKAAMQDVQKHHVGKLALRIE
jgi:NADPH:quinone reductase